MAVLAATVAVAAPAQTAVDGERHGLRGDYYLSSGSPAFDFGEHRATVVDPNIEFTDLEPVFQDLAGRVDNVAARWTGRIEPAYSETYTFSMIGDNGFRLWVDGQLILDNWVDNWDIEMSSDPITLEAGHRYDIKVEMFEHVGGSNLRLRWQSASQPKEIVPPDAFYLPDGFDPPGPTAASVTAAGDTVTLDFAAALATLPDGATEHLALTVAGTNWPIDSAVLAEGDPSVIELGLTYPIPSPAGNTVRAFYDGEGGIAYADGTALEAFRHVGVPNGSTYLIETRWADDVDPDNPWPEYPRPQLTRDNWQSLNGTWQYAAAEDGESPPIGRDLDERIVVPYAVESALSGLRRHEDRMWYRRTFTVPDSWQVGSGQRLLLHLDAVDWRSTVYVNGEQVGTHVGGYDRFSIDVTDALRPSGPQELVVGVHDPTDQGGQPVGKQRLNPGGIFYTPASGIWQSVWMEPVSTAHVTRLQMTPDLDDESLRLTVHAENAGDTVVVATAREQSPGRRVVGQVSGPANTELRLPVPNPTLWSPDNPQLYDLEVELREGGRPVDSVGSYFGMRSVDVREVNGQQRIVLNGEFVFQIGTLDQGFWPDGIYTAPTDEALRYDLEAHKRLGFNTVRKHVKVEPDRWYYWADRLGLLVWQDMPSMARGPGDAERAQFEAELRELVEQHQASPSVVMWVPFNEGWGQYDQARIADLIKSWDPSRLVNNMSGINCCGAVDGGNGDVMDYHIYPGPGSPGEPSATRAAVLGEYGGLGLPLIGHTWAGGGWGYAVEPDKTALTDRYVRMQERLLDLETHCGLSGAIYTQITDLERELNGMLTYDRELFKMEPKRVREANRQLINASGSVGEPVQYPPGTPGLNGVGYWPFDEGTGTVARDEAGDHDATLVNGPTWTSGHNGRALQFSGQDQWADTGASLLDTSGNYSVAAWVKLDSLGGFATAVSQDGDQTSSFFLQYSGADNRFAFSFPGYRVLAPTAPETGRWYHLVGVRDAASGASKLYVDGELVSTGHSCLEEPSTGHTVIGRAKWNGGPVDYWRGALDQVHVYDRALSDQEVSQLYESGN